ncbi:MAG: hypothetical protein AB7Q17_07240 [Phycisphaerae bacterium]
MSSRSAAPITIRRARRAAWSAAFIALAALALLTTACPLGPGNDGPPDFPNIDDPGNQAARFVGASACRQCHADVARVNETHGHNFALNRVEGLPPAYPANTSAGVPDPPPGLAWQDVSYVIGGHGRGARFLDAAGFLVTTAATGAPTQWNLAFAPTGVAAGFVGFEAAPPCDSECFERLVTGVLSTGGPPFQENRPGLRGTWNEPGVRCEACHGPGSMHFRTEGDAVLIAPDRIFVDATGGASCNRCHAQPLGDASGRIAAADGYVAPYNQAAELRASGGHSAFACTICHDPHRSVRYDRAHAIRNECTACHRDATLAGHDGAVFTRGDYTEPVTCVSCHMPFATRAYSTAGADAVGPAGRAGDTRTHIFRIDTQPRDYRSFLAPDGASVALDAQGRAAVTVDFVCLRCHNGLGSVFALTLERAAEIAPNVHRLP